MFPAFSKRNQNASHPRPAAQPTGIRTELLCERSLLLTAFEWRAGGHASRVHFSYVNTFLNLRRLPFFKPIAD
jgi:hypothetical protein